MKTINSNSWTFDLSILNVHHISIIAQWTNALSHFCFATFLGYPEVKHHLPNHYPALMKIPWGKIIHNWGRPWLLYNSVVAHVGSAVQYFNVSLRIWWSANDSQTFGHLLKWAVMETHLQPTTLRCHGVAIISILLTNIWCVHLGIDPGWKSRFMHGQMV